ncbi:MAG: nickel/cobalt transporter (NiCoT) family protein, partial [Pseudonocardiales bacterium]|nr:nickel/cobalt transporter (NiCoT) family protein [Pseudonocardiales bacterium]
MVRPAGHATGGLIQSGPLFDIASIPLDLAGYAIVALFVLAWLVAFAIWKVGRVEEKWS